jgi:ABC-type amino acid transport substrate-binding protein
MLDREGRLVAGRYRLRARLGSGGMGTVWRATDELLERTVAIKEVTLPGDVDEAAPAFQRTLREARTGARLRHPNIVTVHDVVLDDGRPWIVMELVEGPSLAEVVTRDGPLPDDRAVALATQLLAALAHLHEQGVLHRDVKPANVLLDGDRVVLADFGIAAVAGGTALTATNQLIGSPQYLAPERVNGRGAGQESDLWALGITLYFAVTGTNPFRRDDTQTVLAAVLTQEPAPAPGALGTLIAGLLRKDPATRLTAAQAVAALAERPETTRSLTRVSTVVPEASTVPRPWDTRRRLVAALVVVVVSAALVGAWIYRSAQEAADATESTEGTRTTDVTDSVPARMAERGSVVIGVSGDQPGVGAFDSASNSYAGFDIQVAALVANGLGFPSGKVTFTRVDAGNREQAVTTGEVDMVVAAYPTNDESRERVGFAGPYLTIPLNALMRADDRTDPHNVSAARACTKTGSSASAYLEAIYDNGANIVREDDLRACVSALTARRVDAVFSDDVALPGLASTRPADYHVTPFSPAIATNYGIALAPDQQPLRDKVNDILTNALADGTWRAIYDRTLGLSGLPPTIPAIEPS